MLITKQSKLILAYYCLITLWWGVLYFLDIKYSLINYLYQFAFGLIPLLGGISGIIKSDKWGFLKSQVGKAIFFTSMGLVTWGIGQMIWSFYTIFLKIEIPYPSLADLGYVLSWPLWAIGMINLSKATGAKFSLRKVKGKLIFLLIPLIAVTISYYLLFTVARGGILEVTEGALKLFFDLAYPIGDLVILTLALLIFGLSFDYLGGRFKISIIVIILGFVLNYFTDFAFSYVTTAGTYYNGHWVDLLFPTVMVLLAFGINNLDPDVG